MQSRCCYCRQISKKKSLPPSIPDRDFVIVREFPASLDAIAASV
jgi:hypothetical protein